MNLHRYRTLWELSRGERLRYAAAILAVLLSSLALFGVPLVFKGALDGALGHAEAGQRGALDAWLAALARERSVRAALWTCAGAAVVLTALGGLFQYLRGRWASVAAEGMVRRVRERLHAHLQRLPTAFLDGADTGDLVQRCTSDVETLRVFLSAQVVEIGRVVLLFACGMALFLTLSPGMTLVAVALLPPIVLFSFVFFRRIQRVFRAMDESEAELTTVIQENLTGIRVVRAFARQDHEQGKFDDRNGTFRDRTFHMIRSLGTFWSFSDLMCMTQQGLVVLVGAYWTLTGRLTEGTFFAFVVGESMVIFPVRQLGRVLSEMGKATVAIARLEEILDRPEEDANDYLPRTEPAALAGALELRDLRFAYGEGAPALDGVSLRVEAGQTVALLGPAGAGKSTLVKLLLRLYDYEEGSFQVDGQELWRLPRAFVRSQIAAVLQEPFLYSKTLHDNVGLGRPGATRAEIEAAAEEAAVHGSIAAFEHGYETLVGERGVTLSGGQRQRVAIARALLRDVPLLVLDDSLSAVDTRTEASILGALERRKGRRTTILITHRVASIAGADRVFVLEHGRVAQAGTHAELLAQEGPYRRLWQVQGSLEEELADDLERVDRPRESDTTSAPAGAFREIEP